MSETSYAVHTSTCTYLLDEEGVCRWIVSPTGVEPPEVRLCVGAQFVACLDVREGGGLVGELRLGATALFVRRDPETGRKVLLRTRPIEHVETRKDAGALEAELSSSDLLPAVRDDDIETEEVQAARPVRDELTVTLTIPLYRPEGDEAWPPEPPPPRSSRGTSGGRKRPR